MMERGEGSKMTQKTFYVLRFGRYTILMLSVLLLTTVAHAQDNMVLLSPHWEGIRIEFGDAFKEHYKQETGRDVLCPIALDASWKDSNWPKRLMRQVMEYNILDFSTWEDDSAFKVNFKKLIDGLELFYSG